ncbi:hypothetical protein AGABI2DRAFT_190805 [Agaricus bisporus var. bisporus H97]|uniref:hypothetical protein n=1 Tax=Agaricus bisporus var. bisporus (strain H97 / ATCC MYA-4626 / FGSC 10389) TaxID=936046 RepID=UPI00029F5BD7|nr:hypothetical protein AGABI2DRAFT_190805 [Agaricus bisporus var. bisporus H97]EKV50485.1 hypothetical protein AGABI2DRAFT_190805 [Agaricus bisporus var. bisporus H97]
MSSPDVQKAWLVVRQGRPERALKLDINRPVPKRLRPGEVLVRTQAAALNPVGWKLMKLLPSFLARRPHIAEHDFAGVIVDSNRTDFKDGDEVFGWVPAMLSIKTGQGALSQFIRVPADHIVSRPPNVTPIQAAGLSLAGMTAYQALFNVAKLEADQTIFISGGSTAVGAFAIQLAKAAGARVTATASGKNEGFVRDHGADSFIDYTQVDLPKYLAQHPPDPKFNVIFDAVGSVDPGLYTFSEAYLAPGGVFITTDPSPQKASISQIWMLLKTITAAITPRWLGGIKREYRVISVKNDLKDLQAFQKLVADGSVKPIVDSVFEFDDVLKAYERIMSKRATGKVVVKIA